MIKLYTEDETFTSNRHTVRLRVGTMGNLTVNRYEGNVFLSDTSNFQPGQSLVVKVDEVSFNARIIKVGADRIRLISCGCPFTD